MRNLSELVGKIEQGYRLNRDEKMELLGWSTQYWDELTWDTSAKADFVDALVDMLTAKEVGELYGIARDGMLKESGFEGQSE